jgi:hypothetical protein
MRALIFFSLWIGMVWTGIAKADDYQFYKYSLNHRGVTVPVAKLQGVLYNDVCVGHQDTCQALKIYRSHPKTPMPKAKSVETYVGEYCTFLGGAPLAMKSPKEHTAYFCVFDDLSMVDARALYSAHSKIAPL